MTALPQLTNSQQSTYRACPRLAQYRYQLCRRPVGQRAAPLRLGTAIHVALEEWWDGYTMPTAMAGLDPYDAAKACAMLRGYDARWDRTDYDVIAIEHEFAVPLRGPSGRAGDWAVAGKVDAVVRDRDSGDVWVVEHKTASGDIAPGSPYWAKLRLDTQVSTYLPAVAESLDLDVVGCLYDVLGKPAARPLSATPVASRRYLKDGTTLRKGQRLADESPAAYEARLCDAIAADPARYYVRGEVVRSAAETAAAQRDQWEWAQQYSEAIERDRWPRNPGSCERYGRMCDYFDVCSGVASIDDDLLFETTRQHQELSK